MPKLRFSDDEKINMQLRYAAGESLQSIAEDYDTRPQTIHYWVSEEERKRRREYNRLRASGVRP